jgi:hypothetical protein
MELFPEYKTPASGLDVINPQDQAIFGGFMLGEDEEYKFLRGFFR